MKKISVYLLWAVLLCSCSGSKQASTSTTPEEIANAISGDRWMFNAQYASPQGGPSRYLNSREYVSFSKDTLDSGLPYYGSSYTGADVLTIQNPLEFKSTDFTFSKEKDKKGAWVITISPKDYRAVQTYIFTLYDNGNAQLKVTLTNKSSMNYTGYISTRR